MFNSESHLREETRSHPDPFVAIVAEKGAAGELDTSSWNGQIAAESKGGIIGQAKDLCFIPYYLRSNRGGRGQMRVGLRVP
jgi:hypothetical protein